MLGGLAANFTSTSDNPHVRGVIKDAGADEAGMQPWDSILQIDGVEVYGVEGFQNILKNYHANDTITVDLMHEDGSLESVELILTDKYDYYIELGWSASNLETIGNRSKEMLLSA